MPKQIDREERRREIVVAAIAELAESGLQKFSLKNVGGRVGGSVTMVTHYFRSRDELFAELLTEFIREGDETLRDLRGIDDPEARLRVMLDYFLLTDPGDVVTERARMALHGHGTVFDVTQYFSQLEPAMRAVVRVGVEGVVSPANVERAVNFVRLWSSGLALSVVEHPELWGERQQRDSADAVAELLRAWGPPV